MIILKNNAELDSRTAIKQRVIYKYNSLIYMAFKRVKLLV